MSEDLDTKRKELRAALSAIGDPTALKGEALARKPEFQGKQVEHLAIAQDNAVMAKHPEMTQNLSPDELLSLQALGQALPGIESKHTQQTPPVTVLAPVAAPPVESPFSVPEPSAPVFATTAKPAPSKILLTGRSGVGKSYLAALVPGARIVELAAPIFELLRKYYSVIPDSALEPLVATIKAWGDGAVNQKYPLSVARFLFTEGIADRWPGFGNPGYWASQLTGVEGRIVVTKVESSADYNALMALGFKHYHVICSTNTFNGRKRRQDADDRLAVSLDNDVISKLSKQREGPRLNVVWSDSASLPPSKRIFTVAQWLDEMQTRNIAETGE